MIMGQESKYLASAGNPCLAAFLGRNQVPEGIFLAPICWLWLRRLLRFVDVVQAPGGVTSACSSRGIGLI